MTIIDDVSTNDMNFKHLDTAKDIVITPMNEYGGKALLNADHTWTAKVSDGNNYIGDYPVTIEPNGIVVNSADFTNLPAGYYHLEIWEEWIDSNSKKQRSIYPSPQRTIDFTIYQNVTDLAEKEIKTIGFQDVVDQAVMNIGMNYVFKVNTIEPDQTATVVQAAADGKNYVTFNIPQGPQGPKGDKGDKGDTGTVDNAGLTNAPAFQTLQGNVKDLQSESATQETAIEQNKNAITLKANKTDVDALAGLAGIKKIEFSYGKNINTSAGVGNKVTISTESVSNYKYAQVACSPGDFFLINGSGGMNPRLWAFLDSSNTVLACADANATGSNLLLVAPYGASTLIINQSTDLNCFKLPRNMTTGYFVNNKGMTGSMNAGYSIQLGKYSVGETVDITPVSTNSFGYLILECSEDDRFLISGSGGNNPRIWGFLDSNNVLLSIAPSSTGYKNLTTVLTAPKSAQKLVLNLNVSQECKIQFDDASINKQILNSQEETLEEALSGKKQVSQCPILEEDKLSAMVNGKDLSDSISNHIGDLTISTDKMCHCSSFKIINNVIYAAFYVNKNAAAENPTQHTAVFRYASISNLANITNIELCNIGDKVLGKTVNAIYDTVVLKTDGSDDVLYLLFTAKLDNEYYLLYRTYTISTNVLSDISKCQFTVKTITNDFSIAGMKTALDGNGIKYAPFSSDISFMQQLSTRTENGTTYYYTGIGVLDFCFIAKSKDLLNWEYVSQPDFDYVPKFEPAVYVIGDVAYYLCRQDYSISYALLATYNISTDTWSNPVKIPDSQSRSVFFEVNNILYALHAPKDRNHLAILEVNQSNLDQSHDISVADVNDMFYPFVQSVNDQLYVSLTQSRQHIWVSTISLPKIEESTILEKIYNSIV